MPRDPHSGSKVWKARDREIGKPGENRGKVIAPRNLQPTAAFHDRENRCNLRPACGLPMWIQFFRVSKYFDTRNYVHSRIMCSRPVPAVSPTMNSPHLRGRQMYAEILPS